jgi:hypothetical protein
MVTVTTTTVIRIGGITMTAVVLNIEDVRITIIIVDTGIGPMTSIVIIRTTIIKGASTIIRAIGGLGINGIDTQENTRKYTNMEGITANMDI